MEIRLKINGEPARAEISEKEIRRIGRALLKASLSLKIAPRPTRLRSSASAAALRRRVDLIAR